MELIRTILVFAEEQDSAWFAKELTLDGWQQGDVVYNVNLAIEAGLLEGKCLTARAPDHWDLMVRRLTHFGHELLSQIRSEVVWIQVRALAAEERLELSIDFVKAAAPAIAAGMKGTPNRLTEEAHWQIA